MNREEKENLLVDYVLGRLDWEATARLEEMLRTDPELKAQLMAIQAGLETDVVAMDDSVGPGEDLKSRVIQNLGFEKASEEAEIVLSPGPTRGWFSSWLGWSGWGVAAAAVVAIALLQIYPGKHSVQKKSSTSPALAIFDIPAEADHQGRRAPTIREVVYANQDNFDSLSEAEVRAEGLWSRYVDLRANGAEKPKSNGFVVIDLRGKQGFAGFYNVKREDMAQSDETQQLWLYSPQGKAVEVGDLPAKADSVEGVYYFSLDGDDLLMDSFESVIPMISGEELAGI